MATDQISVRVHSNRQNTKGVTKAESYYLNSQCKSYHSIATYGRFLSRSDQLFNESISFSIRSAHFFDVF